MELSKPVIAAISGPTVAGGFELALWTDIRVMEEQAYMGVFCRRWGVTVILVTKYSEDLETLSLAKMLRFDHAVKYSLLMPFCNVLH